MASKLTPKEIESAARVCTVAFAADMLGCAIPGTTPFEAMVRALSMHSWGNTEVEAIRLRCAIWARKNRRAYLAEVQSRVRRAVGRVHPNGA